MTSVASFVSEIHPTPFPEKILRALNIIGIHLGRIVWPWPLSFGYPFEGKWSFNIFFIIGILTVSVVLYFLFKRKRSLTILGLLLFGIYLLPVLQVFPEMDNSMIYDRYLAIPLIGIFIILFEVFKKVITIIIRSTQKFSWKDGLVGKAIPDEILEDGIYPIQFTKLIEILKSQQEK